MIVKRMEKKRIKNTDNRLEHAWETRTCLTLHNSSTWWILLTLITFICEIKIDLALSLSVGSERRTLLKQMCEKKRFFFFFFPCSNPPKKCRSAAGLDESSQFFSSRR